MASASSWKRMQQGRSSSWLRLALMGVACLAVPLSVSGQVEGKACLEIADIPSWQSEAEGALLLDSGLADNFRLTLDLSSRAIIPNGSESAGYLNAIGLDLHKVFSGDDRDWGTLVVQLYLTRIDDLQRRPFFFDGEDDWELVTRVTNFNFTGLSKGEFNIRVGHFEVPFGLEIPTYSNGTIRQLLNTKNLGLKADWGISFNGELDDFLYEISLTRGSGVHYISEGAPFAIAGRIGTGKNLDLFTPTPGWGLSFLYGDILGPKGTTERFRIGIDGRAYYGPFGIMGELSAGEDEGQSVAAGLAELNWQNPEETLVAYLQTRSLFFDDKNWEKEIGLATGVRLVPDSHWALSGQVERELVTRGDQSPLTLFTLQVRYRF